MELSICIQNFLFEKRLCWLLSSILQQEGNIPEIEIKVACVFNSGNPKCYSVLKLFRGKGLNINATIYPEMKDIQFRGLTRNDQLKDCDSDWIMYIDSDMVYPKNFFSELKRLVETDFKDNPHCLHSGRNSTYLEETEQLINSYKYPCVIPNAFELASKLDSKRKSNIGAGYMHLANIEQLRKNHGNFYVKSNRCPDYSWEKKYPKAKSDMRFRRMLGAEKIPLPQQIHLQHVRGSIEGKGNMIYDQK